MNEDTVRLYECHNCHSQFYANCNDDGEWPEYCPFCKSQNIDEWLGHLYLLTEMELKQGD